MMERRMNTGNAQERFGKFGVDRVKNYMGYFKAGQFMVKEIRSETWNSISGKELL